MSNHDGCTCRSPYDETELLLVDEVDVEVRRLLHFYAAAGWKIVLMSGRSERTRYFTSAWLHANAGDYHELLMRPEGDKRPDEIVKAELYCNHVAPYYAVKAVYDDRNKVCSMWRELGLKCFQVAPGAF